MTEEKKTSTTRIGPSVGKLREQRAADTLGLLRVVTELPEYKLTRGRAYVASSPVKAPTPMTPCSRCWSTVAQRDAFWIVSLFLDCRIR